MILAPPPCQSHRARAAAPAPARGARAGVPAMAPKPGRQNHACPAPGALATAGARAHIDLAMLKRHIMSAGAANAGSAGQPACAHPTCREAGLFRAPKARNRLSDYYWFCLGHVREYNRAWDYYKDRSAAEIEAAIREATVWERPSWPLGAWHVKQVRSKRARFRDPFGFGFSGTGGARDRTEVGEPSIGSAERQALAIFELDTSVTLAEIKSCYKRLVKRLHPDANGGDKTAEERLKIVNAAYTTLKHWATA